MAKDVPTAAQLALARSIAAQAYAECLILQLVKHGVLPAPPTAELLDRQVLAMEQRHAVLPDGMVKVGALARLELASMIAAIAADTTHAAPGADPHAPG